MLQLRDDKLGENERNIVAKTPEERLKEVEDELKTRVDKQHVVERQGGQINTLRFALAQANHHILELEEELKWRREAMGEPIVEPIPRPSGVVLPEIPQEERREFPEDIIPGRGTQ